MVKLYCSKARRGLLFRVSGNGGFMAQEATANEQKKFKVPRIPGDIMIYPMIVGLLLNTFCPQVFEIGGFFTAACRNPRPTKDRRHRRRSAFRALPCSGWQRCFPWGKHWPCASRVSPQTPLRPKRHLRLPSAPSVTSDSRSLIAPDMKS